MHHPADSYVAEGDRSVHLDFGACRSLRVNCGCGEERFWMCLVMEGFYFVIFK